MLTLIEGENQLPNWSLSAEEIRSVKGFEELTNDEVNKVINSLVRLAIIAYNAS